MMSAALAPGAAAIVLFGTFLVLFVSRVPVAFALGLACLPSLVLESRLSPMMLFNETFKAYNSFILLAVPFYLLTANLMNVGGVTDRLVRLSRSMVGHFPGALAQINVLLSVFFAAIKDYSTADAASQSKIFIDAQVKEGYGLSFSIAITAVSAVLAVIIPPSILMIVWGGVISTSIGAMYLAGFLPGLLIAAAQMATVHVYAKIYRYPVYPRATLKEFFYSAWISVPALLTAFIIVGGVLLGWFTPTESACVAVLYTIVLSVFVYREMNLKNLYHSFGMNPIHFAIIGIVSLAFGLVTPPYGLCLMISCAVAKVPIRFALKDTTIMLVPMLLMLAAIIIWPDIPLILPRLIAPELLK